MESRGEPPPLIWTVRSKSNLTAVHKQCSIRKLTLSLSLCPLFSLFAVISSLSLSISRAISYLARFRSLLSISLSFYLLYYLSSSSRWIVVCFSNFVLVSGLKLSDMEISSNQTVFCSNQAQFSSNQANFREVADIQSSSGSNQ